MLTRLTVQNLAVVADVTLELGQGLTVVTGETGAGKSVIVDALLLVAGGRGSGSIVRPGAQAARVEAVFEPRDAARLSQRLVELGLPALEEGVLILRREIAADGKNRAFIGHAQVLVSTLREIGDELVDLHGQGEGQGLFRTARQREWVDAHARAEPLVEELGKCLHAADEAAEKLDGLTARFAEATRQRERLEHELHEIESARLLPDEEELLKHERGLVRSREELVEHAGAVCRELLEDENAALTRVSRAETSVRHLASLDPELEPSVELLETARVAMDEVARTVAGRLRGLDFSAERRDEIEARLDLLATLKRKYARSIPDLLAHAQSLREALDAEAGTSDSLATLERERDAWRAKAKSLADRLGEARVRTARELALGVTKELHALGMKEAQFDIRVEPEVDRTSWYERAGKRLRIGSYGAETVEFLLTANPGLPPAPLAKIASGGELSRVMLALKVRLVDVDPADVLVFDEIDAGIGGRTARVVGERLAAIAADRQVVAITHLATVACAGRTHLRVEKVTDGSTTSVRARSLADEDRVAEIARMLSGADADQTARQHARELLASRTGGA